MTITAITVVSYAFDRTIDWCNANGLREAVEASHNLGFHILRVQLPESDSRLVRFAREVGIPELWVVHVEE